MTPIFFSKEMKRCHWKKPVRNSIFPWIHSYGFIVSTCPDEYTEEDFSHLGLIEILIETGFTAAETKQYLMLIKEARTDAKQIRMLKKQRWSLLDDIHKSSSFSIIWTT